MNLFHILDDTFVIIRSRGVYRQAKVYVRGSDVFAGWGGGFVRLCGNGGTSHPNVSWVELSPHPGIQESAGKFFAPAYGLKRIAA